MKKIVFDLETQNTFADVGGGSPDKLDLSVIVIYDYQDNQYHTYTQNDLSLLWPRLEKADLLIGYNSDKFDIPILNKYYPGNLKNINSLDLYSEVKRALGKSITLDMIAEGTLSIKKSGHGLDAVRWWQEGKLDEIKKYCQDDVKITKEIYDYAVKNKKLKYMLVNEILEFPVETEGWEDVSKGGMNMTLPF